MINIKLYGDHLEGLRFHYLLVKRWDRDSQKWECLCDCGKTHFVKGTDLKKGEVKSCGCIKFKKEKESRESKIGKKHGFLKIIKVIPRLTIGKTTSAFLECKCKCGKTTIIQMGKWGRNKSCGCYSGFQKKGEENGLAALTNKQAYLIRQLYKSGSGYTQAQLAKMYKVDTSTINSIVNNHTYKNENQA
jgi:hypothetical protein